MTAQALFLPVLAGSARVSETVMLALLRQRLRYGQLDLTLPSGRSCRIEGTGPGPHAVLRVLHPRMVRRLLSGGAVGLGESYMDGDWESPDLTALLEVADINNQAHGQVLDGHPLVRLGLRLWHRRRDNSRNGSRRNIAAHYDLGNAFYASWLDAGMTYSAALFGEAGETLEEAQTRKYRALADDIGLKPGMTVLEIGCGWGGFAEIAAREYGAQVVGLTLSQEQHRWACDRMARAGLSDRVEIRLQDYRDVQGAFDRIVSIEMIEAVGERWWPTYFSTLHDRLKPGGIAGLQAITISDERFEGYRGRCDFIQRHVFPGGMLPSPGVLDQQACSAGLTLTTIRCFGANYDQTLALWHQSFLAGWATLQALGFDTRFRRLWEFYLAYCRAGFRTGAIDVRHVVLQRP